MNPAQKPAADRPHDAERAFDRQRGRLRAVAYRMLGGFADAEDVVQEAWLRWSRVDRSTVDDPEAYLVRVTTRLAIDRLRSARARREVYVGPWLPEPIRTAPDVEPGAAGADPAERVGLAETVSTAMLLLLEALTPLERAVFVLHEAFGCSYAEIGAAVGSAEDAVRQTARRARAHLEDQRVRYDTDPAAAAAVTERFLAAAQGGDLPALLQVLAPDVVMVCDGGGLAPAPRRPVHGAAEVARALVVFAGRPVPDQRAEVTPLNGGAGIVVRSGDTPTAGATFHLVDGRIAVIHLVSNPDKLHGLARVTAGPG